MNEIGLVSVSIVCISSACTFLFLVTTERPADPCNPSPCGPNSHCRVTYNGGHACTCLPDYYGNPPDCRPECVISKDCDKDKACIKQKCRDPCPGVCGIDALCEVRDHNPICFCPKHLTGDPFVRCVPFPDRKYFWENSVALLW